LSPHSHALLTGRSFFPHLISAPFRSGLHEAFAFAIVACLIAALASVSRGRHQAAAGPSEPTEAGGRSASRRGERTAGSLSAG
jgi:hypothetical protein